MTNREGGADVRALIRLVERLLTRAESGHRQSIGSIDNVRMVQFGVAEIAMYRAELDAVLALPPRESWESSYASDSANWNKPLICDATRDLARHWTCGLPAGHYGPHASLEDDMELQWANHNTPTHPSQAVLALPRPQREEHQFVVVEGRCQLCGARMRRFNGSTVPDQHMNVTQCLGEFKPS